jgi:WD40 repeat protein/uncharacterized membrane protein YgcG
MDVVGALGYVGQDLKFIDGERFAFRTGNSLCIYDTAKGPREMVWKMETGVSSFCTNVETQSIAYAPASTATFDVELVSVGDQSTRATLENPSKTPVIDMCFSREGDKLYAVTDSTNPHVLVWSIGAQCRLLISKKVDFNCSRCECNPCNPNQLCLFGPSGLMTGTINEILGAHTIKLETISLGDAVVLGDQTDVQTSNPVPAVVVWIPLNRILTVDTEGNLYETRLDGQSTRLHGRFTVPDKRGSKVPINPTRAVLSVTNLIVGTDLGHVYWYPIINLMSHNADDAVVELNLPVQTCHVHSLVSALAVDQHFLTLLIGTDAGPIFKVAVDVVESDFGKAEPDPDATNNADATKAFKPVDAVTPVQLGNDPHYGGVVLCSNHLTIEVQKFSARSRSSLSMFVTGSHQGALQFWRYSSQVVDNMAPGGGIRRSAPRALKTVFQLALSSADSAAICSVDFVPLPLKHARLLVIGTEDGCVEVWTLEAQENEDEDARDSSSSEDKGGYSLRLLEDDEGSCLVRLEARRVFQCKLFENPVTLLCSYPVSGANDQCSIKIVAAADGEPHVYFLGAVKDDVITVEKSVESYVTLPAGLSARALTWTEDFLHLFCSTGELLLYQTRDCDVPQLKRRRGTGLSTVVDVTLTSSLTNAVVLTTSSKMRLCPLKMLHDERVGVEFRSFEHPDIVVVTAHAPNGRYFATGCLDGSLCIWRVDGETEEVTEFNRLKPHAGAVSSMAFSSDSSLLLSAAVDGSCFLLTLDKPTTKGPARTGSVKAAAFMQEDGPQYLSDMLPEKSAAAEKEVPRATSTWLELREAEKAKDLRSRHKFKAMGIGAAINEIAQRLRVLISQNAERSELEVLDRSDFVIDVKRKDAAESANQEQATLTRRLYAQRNYCNELRAARIRAKCWDQLDVKATAILPLLASPDSALGLGVTSFSVQKYTPEQLGSLNRVRRLRGMEVRTQRGDDQGSVGRISGTSYFRCAWATALAGCPQSVSWISNDGTRWPVSDKVASLLAAEKVTDASGGPGAGKDKSVESAAEVEDDDGSLDEEDFQLDEGNVLNLLYPPQAVRTHVQKRTQIALLKEVIRQVCVKFNEQFEKLRREKADITASVESRNTRMRAILEDLHQHEELFTPLVANKEVPGSSVVVDPSELKAVPYESEASRQARLREEEEKRQRDLEKDKEDAKGRALDEMMHGTLEVKRDVFAEASAFVKPDWMDTLLPAEMSEAQLKEYDAYMSKLKALQEEQAMYRKALEQEMKRLKNEVAELCKAFDEKLAELASLKVLVHREIFAHEIYISRLALNMAKTEQTMRFLRKSEDQVQSLRADRAELRRGMELLSSQLEDMKTKIGAIQEDERQMDKTFRRDLQNLCNNNFDQDALKVLTQLYRQRTYPRGGGAAAEEFGDQSEADASASASKTHRRSKDSSNRKNSKSQSKRGGGGLGSSSTNDVKNKKLKASKGGASAGGGGGKDSALGPMQQAAQALRTSDEPSYKDKDPYYEALLELEKQKVQQEAQVPILSQLSIELDCPEGFDIDQFSWSKLMELRTARIEKEIEGKVLSIEFSKLKQKLERLDCEEQVLAGCISDIRTSREGAISGLRDLESNLDLVVRLRQGQDEVDRDAVVTDYSDALLLPITVLSKYNSRIKELGKEKISVLSKIKLFRRKINLIDWEAKHHGMEARHYEAYLTDLQLFRVTRELQRVIRDGSDATQTKVQLFSVFQSHTVAGC